MAAASICRAEAGKLLQFFARLESGPHVLLLILAAIMLFAAGIAVGEALAGIP